MIRYMRKIWRQGSKPGVFPRLLEQNPNLITQISRACHRFYSPCSTNPSGFIVLTPPTAQDRYPGCSRDGKWRNAFSEDLCVVACIITVGYRGHRLYIATSLATCLDLCPNVGCLYCHVTVIFSLFLSSPASKAAHLRGFRQSQLCSRQKWLALPSPAAGSRLVLIEGEGPKNMMRIFPAQT